MRKKEKITHVLFSRATNTVIGKGSWVDCRKYLLRCCTVAQDVIIYPKEKHESR